MCSFVEIFVLRPHPLIKKHGVSRLTKLLEDCWNFVFQGCSHLHRKGCSILYVICSLALCIHVDLSTIFFFFFGGGDLVLKALM